MKYIMATEEMLEERIQEFSDLYQLCFNQPLSVEEIKWRYFENPCAKIFAAFAIDEDKLVANYSVSPVEIIRDGNIYPAALSLNTMTHPDYMGRGLFVDLTKLVYKELSRQGYELVMGFPNGLSNRVFVNKLGWKDIYEIPTMELSISNIANPISFEKNIIEDSNFEMQYQEFSKVSLKWGINKSREYLKWKYRNHPSTQYFNYVILDETDKTVRSWIICKEYQNRLNIIDRFFNNENDAEQLILFCLNEGKKRNKDLITAWEQIDTTFHSVYEKHGFQNSKPITYFGACVFNNGNSDYYNYKNWSIQMGDDNVY
jgi:GNAT superfamily N-acetyltransferase